jgi:phosphate/sulfate permease
VDSQLVVAVLLTIGFAVTNGLHDASNAIATLVATRAATPLQAILLASVFNLLGPLFLGAAVADTIGGIVTVPPDVTVEVIGWSALPRTTLCSPPRPPGSGRTHASRPAATDNPRSVAGNSR